MSAAAPRARHLYRRAAVNEALCCLLFALSWLCFDVRSALADEPAALAGPSLAADDPAAEELPRLAAGLIAEYVSQPAAGATNALRSAEPVRRVDPAVAFDWRNDAPDVRLPPGAFRAHWSGRLAVPAFGGYRLHAYAAGRVVIRLAGQTLLDARSNEPAWLTGTAIELDYGYQPLEVEYRPAGDQPRIALFWAGPGFALEPLGPQHLFHDPAATPSGRFERGRDLVQALGCAACHELPEEIDPLSAPSLDRVAGNFAPGWIEHWLTDPRDAAPESRMPDLGLSAADARAIARWLATESKAAQTSAGAASPDRPATTEAAAHERKPPTKPKSKNRQDEPPPTTPVERGLALVHTLGCLACHRVGVLGTQSLYDGGDLTAIADKRPADFFARWLANPAAINVGHRMPVFRLSNAERDDLAEYLATLHGAPREPADHTAARDSDAGATTDARQLIERHHCAACHQMPDAIAKRAAVASRIADGANWEASCLGDPRPQRGQPGYRLASDDVAAIREYLTQTMRGARPSSFDRGQALIARNNCLGCHARGGAAGLSAQAAAIAELLPQLGTALGGLTPPPLDSVGDKLHEPALAAAIKTSRDPLRPWLSVRMPRFDLADLEVALLVEQFVAIDRIPSGAPIEGADSAPPASLTELAGESLLAPGARLVTSDGFGCASCHQIGNVEPQRSEPGTRGVELSLVGQRVRASWFDRWVRNPARIVPRIEMPSVQQPVRGVCDERLDLQLAAVWTVLNRPGFNPPEPNPVRVLRRRNLPDEDELPVFVQDVFQIGNRKFVDPLVIGLPNRHNLLFDLEMSRLAGWWIGDTARQRTKGKSWHWEPGGTLVAPLPDQENADDAPATSEMLLLRGDEIIAPQRVGQSLARLDRYSLDGLLSYTLQYALPSSESCSLNVTETLRDNAGGDSDNSSGFTRHFEVVGIPPGWQAVLRPWSGAQSRPPTVEDHGHVIRLAGALGDARVTVRQGQFESLRGSESDFVVRPAPDRDGSVRFELEYQTDAAVDRYVAPAPIADGPVAVKLDVVPGFAATQLPLPPEIMPTSMAWRNDGALVFTSLKGQVYVARDDNHDELEDRLELFADGLAAPYGIAASGDGQAGSVEVIHKPALVRLLDLDRDGAADSLEVLASGWGHTDDYHDWAVGLPRAGEGGYYAALPCQQDDRSPAAALLRGQIVRLAPPTGDAPHENRRWSIEPLAAGLRFPMGLAVDRRGELFASDNQGNYNPFNELNHIEAGQRYGFINKLEGRQLAARREKPPAFRAAAIEIPHPWTRSVNGIVFLDTPPALLKKSGRETFGPFEGHLVGCEYDTRRLIRMSLERIDGVYQGAAYPFSVPPATADSPTFEGPVACAVSPAGDLYVGNLRDSGWGAGANTGSMVRLRPTGDWPLGIAAVSIAPRGFIVRFTGAVDADRGASAENYAIESYRRISTPEYGGPDVDRRREAIRSVTLADDHREVRLELGDLRTDSVYEIRVRGLGPGGAALVPDEAHYTVRRMPRE